MKFKETLLLV